jgi:hypothetical protein
MSSLKQDFDELVTRIQQGREFRHASFEPIYYLVFSPKQIIEVKRQTKAWIQMLQKQGFNVHTFSIAEHVNDILKSVPAFRRALWFKQDAEAPLEWVKTNAALTNAVDGAAFKQEIVTGHGLPLLRCSLGVVNYMELLTLTRCPKIVQAEDGYAERPNPVRLM